MSPLTVGCSCGKHLVVKPELLGRTVLCPACRAVLKLPAPRAESLVSTSPARVALAPALTLPAVEDDAPPEETPPRRVHGWTLFLAGIILFNLGVVGYFLVWKPYQERHAQPPAGAEVNLVEVAHDYADSKRAGDRRWKGRRLRVAGLIVEAKEAGDSSAHVWLSAGPDCRVCCFFPPAQQEAFARLLVADRVVLDGDLTDVEPHAGTRANLFLHNCRVVPAAAP